MNSVKRIIIAEIVRTPDGVEINGSTVLCLTCVEEELIGGSLELLGYKKLDREALVKKLVKQHADKPLFLMRAC